MCTPPLSPGPVDAPLACLGRHGSSAPSSANADLAGAVGVRMGFGSAGESRFHLRKAFRMKPMPIVFWVLWMSVAVKVTVAGLSWSICSKEALAGAK